MILLFATDNGWVLETAGKCRAAKKVGREAAITNAYSILHDYDLNSGDLYTVAHRHRVIVRVRVSSRQGSLDKSPDRSK